MFKISTCTSDCQVWRPPFRGYSRGTGGDTAARVCVFARIMWLRFTGLTRLLRQHRHVGAQFRLSELNDLTQSATPSASPPTGVALTPVDVTT